MRHNLTNGPGIGHHFAMHLCSTLIQQNRDAEHSKGSLSLRLKSWKIHWELIYNVFFPFLLSSTVRFVTLHNFWSFHCHKGTRSSLVSTEGYSSVWYSMVTLSALPLDQACVSTAYHTLTWCAGYMPVACVVLRTVAENTACSISIRKAY